MNVNLFFQKKQLDEINRVLNYPKFEFTEEQRSRFLNLLLNVATLVETSGTLNVIKEDHDDNAILEAAVEHDAEFIISGDVHLLKIQTYENIKILTANEFLEEEK
jgi:uncharacterized protein